MCVMRAIRGCMSVPEGDPVDITFPFLFFFSSCAAWGPAPRPPVPRASEPGTPRLVCTVVGNPPVGRDPVDKGPCRQRGESGSISTSPGIRGGNTDLGLSIATPPGRRRESGCDFARATA